MMSNLIECKDRLGQLSISKIMGHITSQLLVPNMPQNVRTNSHK